MILILKLGIKQVFTFLKIILIIFFVDDFKKSGLFDLKITEYDNDNEEWLFTAVKTGNVDIIVGINIFIDDGLLHGYHIHIGD
jgi:hypothetical protein